MQGIATSLKDTGEGTGTPIALLRRTQSRAQCHAKGDAPLRFLQAQA